MPTKLDPVLPMMPALTLLPVKLPVKLRLVSVPTEVMLACALPVTKVAVPDVVAATEVS